MPSTLLTSCRDVARAFVVFLNIVRPFLVARHLVNPVPVVLVNVGVDVLKRRSQVSISC
jgi:hypothetical protein